MEFAPLSSASLLIFDRPIDIAIIMLVALILFGGDEIPKLMQSLGRGIRDFLHPDDR